MIKSGFHFGNIISKTGSKAVEIFGKERRCDSDGALEYGCKTVALLESLRLK